MIGQGAAYANMRLKTFKIFPFYFRTLLSLIGFSILLGTLYDVCLHRPALKNAKTAVVVVGK